MSRPHAIAPMTVPVATLAVFALWGAYYIFRTSIVVGGERVFVLWDDMMIAMQYARNFCDGHGLVWMAGGERAQGFVDLAMVAFMVVVHALPISPLRTSLVVQGFELLVMLCLLGLVWGTVRRLLPERVAVAHAALLATAASAPLAIWSLQGSDVGLAAIWGVAAIWLLARTSRWPGGFTPLLSIGALIRPDLAVPAAAMLGAAALRADRPVRRLAIGLAGIVCVALSALVFQKLYWGDWMPLPYHNKMTGSPKLLVLGKGLENVSVWLPPLLPAFVFAGIGVWKHRARAAVLACAVVPLAACAYDLWVGGDWQPESGSRFFAPWLPMVIIPAALGADALIGRLPAPPAALRNVFVVAVTVLLSVASNPSRTTLEWLTAADEPMKRSKNERNLRRALYFRDHSAPDTRLALHFGGVPGYFSERPAIDVFGRTNSYVAKLEVDRFIPAHSKWDWDYLMSKQPDVFLIASRGLGDRPDFRALYYRAVYPSPGMGAPFYVRKRSADKLLDPNVVLSDQTTGERVHPRHAGS